MGYTAGTGSRGTDTFNATTQTVADLQRLNDKLAERGNFLTGTTATRTAMTGTSVYEGLHFYDTTNNTLYRYTDTWLIVYRMWTAYTPTVTGMSVGNGTMEAKYMYTGKKIDFTIEFTWGSTSSVSGDVTFSLPVTPASPMFMTVGQGLFNDVSSGIAFPVDARVAGGGAVAAALIDHSTGTHSRHANLSNTSGGPAVGDTLYLGGSYEVA